MLLRVLIPLLLPGLGFCYVIKHKNNFWEPKQKIVRNLMITVVDTIRATEIDMENMEHIRVNNRNSPAYEMGFLMKTLQENYRKQLEKYIVVRHMGTRLYTSELIIFLVEIEHHFWETEHICNMIHEIERKWGIKGKEVVAGKGSPPVSDKKVVIEMPPSSEFDEGDAEFGDRSMVKDPSEAGGQTSMPDAVKKILSELSWASKAKVIEKYFPSKGLHANLTSHNLMFPSSIKFKERPGGFPLRKSNRRFQIDAQVLAARQGPGASQPAPEPLSGAPAAVSDDDKSMKLKLFRLMYEMIRDSDLKVVRAEQIRTHYTNSTAFDIGYLLGDVNDKFNVMTDIRNTVKRLYAEWKPIEHINAYEQIANQAIEINHLIDMVNSISKKGI